MNMTRAYSGSRFVSGLCHSIGPSIGAVMAQSRFQALMDN